MEHHDKLKLAADTLLNFVKQPHEGLGPDEQAKLKIHCMIIRGIANGLKERSSNG